MMKVLCNSDKLQLHLCVRAQGFQHFNRFRPQALAESSGKEQEELQLSSMYQPLPNNLLSNAQLRSY